MKFHPDRESLIAEAHARPSQNISIPSQVLQVAFKCPSIIQQRCFEIVAPTHDSVTSRHCTGEINGIRIKLERHTEFISCMLFRDLNTPDKLSSLPDFFRDTFPADELEVLVLLQVDVVKTTAQMLKLLPLTDRIYGGKIRSLLDVRSTFKPDENGCVNFVVHGRKLTGDELGRRIQRLVEMETYRTMSLLGLSKAREIGPAIFEFESELDALTVLLSENQSTSSQDDEALFEKLSALSEKNNILASETRYRFSASQAYYALFQQRITSLEEEKVGDVQTMSGFLKSRLEPAIATIESTAKRQETLTNDLSRALTLLRTRIELNLNKGNQALLQSMDRRHDQQLKISRTVEGLSVVAITYYAVGLVSYLLKALAKQTWMPFSETFLTAFSVPFILIIVWYSLHRIRNAWENK